MKGNAMGLNNKDFDDFLSDIVPKEIPVKFVNYIVVTFNNGRRSRLHREDLLAPSAVAQKGVSWKKIKENFKDIKDIEIQIDNRALKKHINQSANELLKNHFPTGE